MANEKLQIDITAKDDASKVIDPLQKKVAKLEQGKTTVKVEADAKKAIDDVDSFAAKLSKLGAEDQVVLLSLKAAAAQSELTKLGSELADIDSSDPTIDIKLERYEQVSGDLDQLQSKIKQIGDTPVASGGLGRELGGVKTKLEGMRGEADQSRSVLANLVGNSAQDLGELGGVAGTTGVAIGQLAEYAADGNISLGNLAKFAGPMALVGVALFSVTTIMGEFKKEAAEAAKIKAFNVANAKEFADAAADGVDIVERYVETSKKAGKVEVAAGTKDFAAAVKLLGAAIPDDELLVLNDHIHDIGPALVAAGQSAESFYAAASDTDKLAAFEDAVRRSNLPVQDQADLIAAVIYQQGRYAAGQDLAQRNASLFATAQQEANTNAAEGASLLEGLAASTDDSANAAARAASRHDDLQTAMGLEATAAKTAADALNDQVSALEADARAHQDLIDGQRAAVDSAFAVDKAQADFNKTLGGVSDALKTAGKDAAAQKVVYDDVAQAAGDVAEAHVQLARDQATANGTTLSAADAIDLQNQSLVAAAKQAKGPARDAILSYAAAINGIDDSVKTDIEAALNKGDYDEANRLLSELSSTRKAAVTVDVENASVQRVKGVLADLSKDRIVQIRAVNGQAGTARATGGPVRAGEAYLVGDGPGGVRTPWSELFIPNTDGTILTSTQTKAALSGQSRATGGSTGRVQNITHISQAAPVAAVAAGPVVDPSAAEDRRQAALYKTGQISLDVYQAYVKQRAEEEKATDSASDAYVQQYDLLQQLTDQQKKAADDQIADQDRVMKNMHDLGAISDQEYKTYLEGRIANFGAYTDGYTQLAQQIKGIDDEQVADHKKALDDQAAADKAYYTQAQAVRDAAEAEAAANEQLAAVFAAGDEGGRIQKDRHASADDKAAAVQKLVDEQEKLADTAYRAAIAKASAEGLDVGSIPWDRYVRSVLDASIAEYQAAGLGITVGKLQGYESGIPALAKGGVVKATPGGTLAVIGEGGKDEAVIPLDSARGLGGDTHIYNIEVRSLSKPTPREMQLLAEELAKLNRRNGRAA